ncbi:MAG: ABC transporter permease [Theionarchaea archaeon]|nr:ABC transporter permease [Theionarchaea archaeon]MBU7001125.1 ABC transporter permease [Theionarchaea archaeon]MBU7019904.1 ABC transporter permease [Theionarchaea archaeon]MBU7035397.1 ABC transporter permease [Theionarchaea archaeon]MBU7041329.1 ABC transporter permease [Theionarchaea archaeon]
MNVMLNLRALKGRAYPRMIGAVREPSWMFWETFLPILSMAAYVYVYRSLDAPKEFEGFVILGGVMTTYWMNVLWGMASQLYWEKETANLQLYLAAPMSKMSILAGMALGGMFSTSVRCISIIVMGVIIFKVDFVVTNAGLLLGIFGVTLVALYGMGMVFASLFLMWGREAWHLNMIMEEPIYFLSGYSFPVKALGSLSLFATVIPFTLGLDAMRQLTFPSMATQWGLVSPHLELVILLVMSIILLYLARVSLDRMERMGRSKGTLTMRWQ